MSQLYKACTISKQAVSQYACRQAALEDRVGDLVIEAELLREEHPGCGVEKMYYTLNPDFMGRDRFIALFMDLGFRLKRSKNYRRTTHGVRNSFPNLIKGMKVSAPSVIWQSDITYYSIGEKFYYAVFIIDVYTKKIVGYQLSTHMRATANIKALEMALMDNKAPEIHHSDRGSQYLYKEYIQQLKEKGSQISMALSAQDNAYAERINRTIKEEYLDRWNLNTFEQLKKGVDKAVHHYNNKRKHKHLKRMTPVEFEEKWCQKLLPVNPIITIFDNENNLKTVNTI